MTDDEWDRRLAALKANATAADDLACAICELEGGDALVERTHARNEAFNWVWRHPRYDKATRRAILSGTRAKNSA